MNVLTVKTAISSYIAINVIAAKTVLHVSAAKISPTALDVTISMVENI
jgi:hypothetical protein